MAVSSSKLLPRVNRVSGKSLAQISKTNNAVNPEYVIIKKQVIKVESLISGLAGIQKKEKERKRVSEEQTNFRQREKKLESSFNIKPSIKLPSLPKLGFLDLVKNFIVNVILGFIAVRMVRHLPKLIGIFKMVLQVQEFILDTAGFLFNGLVTFVDAGYKAYDFARSSLAKICGIGGKSTAQFCVEQMDSLTSLMNRTIQTLIIGGLLFSDFGSVGKGGLGGGLVDAGADFVRDKLLRRGAQQAVTTGASQAAGTAGSAAGVGAGAATAVVAGVGLLSSALGEGAFQLKKAGKGTQKWFDDKIKSAKADKNPITRFLKQGFWSMISSQFKVGLWFLNGMGTVLDVIGAPFRYAVELIRFGVMKLANDQKGIEEQRKNLGKFDARVRDGIREQFAFLAPAFKLLGMKKVGEGLEKEGSFGSLYGDKSVKDMGYMRGGVVKKFAEGGKIDAGDIDKTEVKRQVKKERSSRLLSPEPRKIDPGSDVGGLEEIQEMFPQSENRGNIKKDEMMNPYGYMLSSHQKVADIKFVGPLMSLVTRVLLGDNVNKSDFRDASIALNSWIIRGVKKNTNKDMIDIIREDELARIIEGSLLNILDKRLTSIQNELRFQLGLEPIKGAEEAAADGCPCPEESGGGGSGGAVSGDSTDKAILDLIASVESGGYDSVNTTYGASIGKPTSMTIEEIGRRGRGATGRYQHMPQYLVGRARAAGVNPNEKFTPANQDKITLHFLRTSHPYDKWRSGSVSDEAFGKALAKTWRGLPYSPAGTYADGTPNKAHISWGQYMSSLKKIKAGSGGTSSSSPGSKISSSSNAANVDDCVCDPETPNGDPGDGVGGVPGPSNFIQGNSGASYGIHFHIAPGSYETGDITSSKHNASARSVAFQVAKAFGGKKSIYLGRSGASISGKESDSDLKNKIQSEQVAHTARGSQGGIDLQVGGAYYPGAAVKFPLRVEGMKYRPGGFGVVAKVVGANASVAHGRYDEKGRQAPQEGAKMYFHGGFTGRGGPAKLHEGEFVIDKDSVEAFGTEFLRIINSVENQTQLSSASSRLMEILSTYTGRKEMPELIIEEGEDVPMAYPFVMGEDSSSSFDGGYSPNWEQDMLAARG